MLPFGVTIPATVPQRSEIPEGLMNNPVCVCIYIYVYMCVCVYIYIYIYMGVDWIRLAQDVVSREVTWNPNVVCRIQKSL